ncbi:MAG: SET domain-containing protein-lysine N-methyltransferase [Bryobacterales bacterium]|nr:SET domain-containing protein-lysine N-methyltransferase [Bryobacterales bacterium]
MARTHKPLSNGAKPENASREYGSTLPVIDANFAAYRLEARPSRIHRWGIYALERIPAGRKVIEYTGEKISRRETKRRSLERDLHYLFTLNSYWCIDGTVGGSGAEFINHSCAPNISARIIRNHILYMSKRAIEPGEELLIDYRFEKDMETVPCACGARNCRGTINLRE